MATIFQSPRIRIPRPHSSATPISYPRSSSIPAPPPRRRPFAATIIRRRLSSVQSKSSVTSLSDSAVDELEAEDEEGDDEIDPMAEVCFLDQGVDRTVGSITEWELDFCSRPILDERGKKVWELVVCDSSLSLQYTKYFPNNVINSITLRDAIASITQDLGVPLPEKIRFFRPLSLSFAVTILVFYFILFGDTVTGFASTYCRSQMQTIITKACSELGIKPVPTKRCISLLLWLEERYENVYTRHPGFQKGSKPFLALDNPFPMELPENLSGERWAFVQLPYSAVKEEISSLEKRQSFGATLDLDLLGLEIEDKTLVPGVAVASSRAKPLAAWMNGLEVGSMEVDTNRGCLILSAGVSTRYTYATYKKTPVTTREAESWEAAKRACGGLHFLAIQENLDSEDCFGFWLLLDLPPPPV